LTIKEINEIIEREYNQENIQNVHNNWFPLMKYDEEYGVSKSFNEIEFLVVGLNPSLTTKFAEHIHSTIFEIEDIFDPKSNHDYGRKEIYLNNKAAITKKLIDYQALLKYDSKERIPYFKQLENFFIEIENKTSFKENIFHYDFCQLRHTDSNGIKKTIEDNYEILAKHLDTIIEVVQPKIIFVFNGTLAKLLKVNNFFVFKFINFVRSFDFSCLGVSILSVIKTLFGKFLDFRKYNFVGIIFKDFFVNFIYTFFCVVKTLGTVFKSLV
jgi:hypothetical protein